MFWTYNTGIVIHEIVEFIYPPDNMTPEIDCNFPGGNIIVEGIDGDDVYLHQDLRDTDRDWFYWCFRVRAARGKKLHFIFTRSRAIGVRGPAVSFDDGITWTWLGTGCVDKNSFSFAFPHDCPEARFSFAMPYQVSRWTQFVPSLTNTTAFSIQKLCTSEKGRDVPCMLAGCLEAQPQYRVAITCRHHCCEMMADYVLEGLLKLLVDGCCEESQWLRRNAGLLIVPFADIDGVEEGDQGKGRSPRDHGRDYEGESLFSSTAKIRQLVPQWSRDSLTVAIDLHCPHISGKNNEVIYLVGSPYPQIAQQQRLFSKILESTSREGKLPFRADDYLPFGKDWNTGTNYSGGKSFARWACELPGITLSTAIETPYANAGGAEVNQVSAHSFGENLGSALAEYLQQLSQ